MSYENLLEVLAKNKGIDVSSCYVGVFKGGKKRYDGWQLCNTFYKDGFVYCGKSLDFETCEQIVGKFKEFHKRKEIRLISRQYKYAPEIKPEAIILIRK